MICKIEVARLFCYDTVLSKVNEAFMFVVTGGATGIGRALTQALTARSQEVLIVGRREPLLEEVAKTSPLINYVVADVSTTLGREKIVEALSTRQHLSGLIHNAGIVTPIAPLKQITAPLWHQAIATNLDAPLFLTQALYSQLVGGRVLHIGSAVAHFAVKTWGAYCVSKAALFMLMQCWQLESEDIAFSSVMPGIIDTDMQALIRAAAHMDTDKQQFFKDLQHNNQLLSPHTVALFLAWLLLDASREEFVSKEWDIYDEVHHSSWLEAEHHVPKWEQ